MAGLRNEEMRGGRAGLPAAGPARLRHRPAAQPAVHPRLQRLDPGPGGRHQPGDAGPERETTLTARSTPTTRGSPAPEVHGRRREPVEGGDVLLLSPGVVAVGVGERTTPAGVERLARTVFAAALAHTVLAVPIAQERATMHLDTVCTMVDVDAVVMYPNIADTLEAYTVTAADDGTPLRRGRRAVPGGRRQGDGASTRCTRSTPAWTRSPPSASSGTTATTRSRSRPAWRWPTSATWRPTPGSRRPASRSSRSPAASSAAAAAARGACPARSAATTR